MELDIEPKEFFLVSALPGSPQPCSLRYQV